jgi:pimeloyl-ACP methyl ester carboxylesterase
LIFTVLWTQLERIFVFFPISEIIYTPAQMGLEYKDVYFTTKDGQQLHGWYVPGNTDVTLLWFHGNGGNISHRVPEIAQIHYRLGVNLFIFDYRGYGRSEGVPSESGTYRDSRAALAYLQGRADLNPQKIIYFGQSLGAAVAVELAAHQPPLGLVLIAPFVSSVIWPGCCIATCPPPPGWCGAGMTPWRTYQTSVVLCLSSTEIRITLCLYLKAGNCLTPPMNQNSSKSFMALDMMIPISLAGPLTGTLYLSFSMNYLRIPNNISSLSF